MIYQYYNLRPEGTLGIADFEYLYMTWISLVFTKAIKVPGHIVEIGVASGRNSIIFGKFLDITSEKFVRKYYGFDTFDGYSKDTFSNNPWLKKDSWKGDIFTKRHVENRVKENGFNNICSFIQGDCRESIPDFLNNYEDNMINKNEIKIALLYIDCNAYEPALYCLNTLYPYITPGGIIAIDETIQGGETKALIEFAKKQNLKLSHEVGGNPAFILKP